MLLNLGRVSQAVADENQQARASGQWTHPQAGVFKVKTVILAVDLKKTITKKQLMTKCKAAEWDEGLKACVLQLRDSKAKAFIYLAGNMVVEDSRSVQGAIDASRQFVDALKASEVVTNVTTFGREVVCNIIAEGNMPFGVNLTRLWAFEGPKAVTYSPELHPAAFYRVPGLPVVATILASGQVILSRGHTMYELIRALQLLYPVLARHPKDHPPAPAHPELMPGVALRAAPGSTGLNLPHSSQVAPMQLG